MKILKDNQTWSTSLKAVTHKSEASPRPKIGDDDGISNRALNAVIILFMLLTVGVSIATAAPTEDVKYRILLRQAMLDMDRLEYDKAITKLLEVRANTEENANVSHMIGLCYLYGQNSPEKAVFYLNRAISAVSVDYEAWDLDESRAPVQTSYHLAKAYESLEDFAKAAEYYGMFLNYVQDDSALASSRTYTLISRNAEKCRVAAANSAANEAIDNVVLNQQK